MNLTHLTMLPSQRYDSISEMPVMERDGFVDESVVLALLVGPIMPRQTSFPGDLVLAADEMDYAGWRFSDQLPARATSADTATQAPETRRPAAPILEEPGIGHPHRGSHRWWLAGLAGALSALLFSVLLLSLSSRDVPELEGFTMIRTPAQPQANPAIKSDSSASAPELTGVSKAQ